MATRGRYNTVGPDRQDVSESPDINGQQDYGKSEGLPRRSLKTRNNKCSAVAPFRFLAAMILEVGVRAEKLPCCPSLDRDSRDAEVGFEPRVFLSVSWRHQSP
ncbi:hypothetical protein T265_08488 [Opisthorchis viverrini]|uniref:Uncharacterized protein n=1 Tax=Opisthorchis viverrini TaxID=6198 RepID=A0A075A8A6_OPIVI|nr:hypothetical protein T265_08488 [Opisthorchis viverrini]KER23679.1 hypothetical protein T265_08488 [Opisthorchis viverrini]